MVLVRILKRMFYQGGHKMFLAQQQGRGRGKRNVVNVLVDKTKRSSMDQT